MPRNASESSKYMEIKSLIDCYTKLKILKNPDNTDNPDIVDTMKYQSYNHIPDLKDMDGSLL